jgi:putative colanic acid biosysnthesis UDP-glucose lipid carrier transferase
MVITENMVMDPITRCNRLSLRYNRILKRSLDVTVSALFLLMVFPIIFLIIGTIIKMTSKGPVFFNQKRTGINEVEFDCLKFRTMIVNNKSDILQASADDQRKTKVGDFLRRTNLDEFPQFINVFKGDMSLVGPRPHMLKHTRDYSALIPNYMIRHRVKPGITGWSQVNGFRGETKKLSEMECRVKYDIWYLENWSFCLDLYIILKTFKKMLVSIDKKAY